MVPKLRDAVSTELPLIELSTQIKTTEGQSIGDKESTVSDPHSSVLIRKKREWKAEPWVHSMQGVEGTASTEQWGGGCPSPVSVKCLQVTALSPCTSPFTLPTDH